MAGWKEKKHQVTCPYLPLFFLLDNNSPCGFLLSLRSLFLPLLCAVLNTPRACFSPKPLSFFSCCVVLRYHTSHLVFLPGCACLRTTQRDPFVLSAGAFRTHSQHHHLLPRFHCAHQWRSSSPFHNAMTTVRLHVQRPRQTYFCLF